MKIHIFSTIFLFFISTTLATASNNTFKPTSNDTDFIRTSCQTTLYPQICFTSLAGYSSAIQQNPARLARVAIGVTLNKAKHMAKYVANISHSTDYGTHVSSHIYTHISRAEPENYGRETNFDNF